MNIYIHTYKLGCINLSVLFFSLADTHRKVSIHSQPKSALKHAVHAEPGVPREKQRVPECLLLLPANLDFKAVC